VQLWSKPSNWNIEIIQRFQVNISESLITWYVTNDTLHHDLNVSYVRDDIKKLSQRYADRLVVHPNIAVMSEAETQIEEKAAS